LSANGGIWSILEAPHVTTLQSIPSIADAGLAKYYCALIDESDRKRNAA